jgi:hypothetical protein
MRSSACSDFAAAGSAIPSNGIASSLALAALRPSQRAAKDRASIRPVYTLARDPASVRICSANNSQTRSSPLSFTIYFFTAICFAVTKHLRRCGVIDSEIHREINDLRSRVRELSINPQT